MGPLANPARVSPPADRHRPSRLRATVYAEALELLGTEAALIVSGEEGLDELSGAGPSLAVGNRLRRLARPHRCPRMPACRATRSSAIRGGDPAHNALALRRLLGGETGAYRDAVLLNAAAALVLAGTASDLRAGAAQAAEAIDSGAANDLLDRWIAW